MYCLVRYIEDNVWHVCKKSGICGKYAKWIDGHRYQADKIAESRCRRTLQDISSNIQKRLPVISLQRIDVYSYKTNIFPRCSNDTKDDMDGKKEMENYFININSISNETKKNPDVYSCKTNIFPRCSNDTIDDMNGKNEMANYFKNINLISNETKENPDFTYCKGHIFTECRGVTEDMDRIKTDKRKGTNDLKNINGMADEILKNAGSIEDARGKEVDNFEVESWVLELEINERPVEFKLDTGAMANVIPVSVLKAFENKEFDENIDIEIEAQVCLISMNLNITDEKRKEYIKQTDLDNELIALKNLIKEGWPSKIKDVPENLKFYHRFKHEITEINEKSPDEFTSSSDLEEDPFSTDEDSSYVRSDSLEDDDCARSEELLDILRDTTSLKRKNMHGEELMHMQRDTSNTKIKRHNIHGEELLDILRDTITEI
ncbi:hypothetical protein JTB14_036303 [Gonioctena quinquepunctata]|nr:hypothetical protein JTB14_036303 [Gonioctena quinquepunctata]